MPRLAQVYATGKLQGKHEMIHKAKGRSVRRKYINGIESFWSHIPNWLYLFTAACGGGANQSLVACLSTLQTTNIAQICNH